MRRSADRLRLLEQPERAAKILFIAAAIAFILAAVGAVVEANASPLGPAAEPMALAHPEDEPVLIAFAPPTLRSAPVSVMPLDPVMARANLPKAQLMPLAVRLGAAGVIALICAATLALFRRTWRRLDAGEAV